MKPWFCLSKEEAVEVHGNLDANRAAQFALSFPNFRVNGLSEKEVKTLAGSTRLTVL